MMEERKLISMVEFVVLKRKELLRHKDYKNDLEKYANIVYNYANFLSQPLTIVFFVPCDLDGNVLVKPVMDDYYMADCEFDHDKWGLDNKMFFEAKDRVLFEGFEMSINKSGGVFWFKGDKNDFFFNPINKKIGIGGCCNDDYPKTIEDLCSYDLTLTQTAIKQIEG